MTIDSGSTVATATPEPSQTFRQKHREGEATFAFFPDFLGYAFVDRKGTKVNRRIPWGSVPARFHARDRAMADLALGRKIRLSMLAVLILVNVQYPQIHVSVLLLAYAALACMTTLWLSRHRRAGHTLLGTKQGNIVIFHGADHDTILDQILRARAAFYRRFATIDPGRSNRWNLQRLRWLLEQDVLSPQEFAAFQHRLLPGFAEPLLRKPAEMPDRRIDQSFFNSAFVFDFKPDFLAYRRRTAIGNEYAVNHRYLDLEEPKLDVQSGSPSQLIPHVLQWSGLIALAYVAEMYARIPHSALTGPGALQQVLAAIGPGIVAFAIVAVVAPRLLRVVCTKLPSGVTILKDKHHDAVIAEWLQRRQAALKTLARPDPLLSRTEQADLFAALVKLRILEAEAVPDLLARAEALQAHLGLADPGPAADLIPGETPREPDTPKTLH